MSNMGLIEALEQLRQRATVDGVEEYLSESNFCESDLLEVNLIKDEFFAEYEKIISEVSEIWGDPIFNGEKGTKGFPEWCEAEWLAHWLKGSIISYVALRQDDKEYPFVLLMGAKKKDKFNGFSVPYAQTSDRT